MAVRHVNADNAQDDSVLYRWQKYLAKPTPACTIAASAGSLLLVGLIAWINILAGPEIQLFVFYLLPVLGITLYLGRQTGVAAC
ncbi:hypothetical protein [Duganella radicis]|uniref:Uncharacterized protein n=1 Tax=Duganella radicis TaxID=551988 RepID=A0A6L6PHC2_9BURK|nr:hypothetical protein [Duganella radicis]MTV38372.1 hypothetical protein [Duganella radicis]